MREQLHSSFWIEGALALVSSALALATLVWRDWLELVFGVDPDHGSGAVEWGIVALLAAIALVSAALARRSYLKAQAAH